MKHRLLNKWNMLLGSLSLLLAGCGTSQKSTRTMPERQIMAMYGVPVERYEPQPLNANDTIVEDVPVQKVQTTEQDTTMRQQHPIMVKYGVPYPRN